LGFLSDPAWGTPERSFALPPSPVLRRNVTEGKDGKFRFTVRSGDGKLLAMSGPTGYADEKAALKAIEDLKTALKTAKVMPTKKATK
jgi:uncharacterized protein YegP (UPF0339 family)